MYFISFIVEDAQGEAMTFRLQSPLLQSFGLEIEEVHLPDKLHGAKIHSHEG